MILHPTALVDPSAVLAEGVTVGAFSVIGPAVRIGEGTVVASHVVITGATVIGRENRIHQFASLGDEPQDRRYAGEATRLEIGDRNVFRESCSVHRGTVQGGGVTRLGSDNLFMACVHVGHDCRVGNRTVFANSGSLGAGATVADHAILGGFTRVRAGCAVGAHTFSAMGSNIESSVPPFMMVAGSPAQPHGLNSRGLQRRGFSPDTLRVLRRAYRTLYRTGYSLEEALALLREMPSPEIATLTRFVEQYRDIVR